MDPLEAASAEANAKLPKGSPEAARADLPLGDAPKPAPSMLSRLITPWHRSPRDYEGNVAADLINNRADNATNVEAAGDAHLGESIVLAADAMMGGSGEGPDFTKTPVWHLAESVWRWRSLLIKRSPEASDQTPDEASMGGRPRPSAEDEAAFDEALP